MGRPYRIMHFIDSGGLYGAESVLLNLSGAMQESGRYEPVVGCIVSSADAESNLYDEANRLGLEARKIVIRNGWLPIDLPRAAQRLKRLGIDLIHSHGYKPSVFGQAMKPGSGVSVMATCHLWFQGTEVPLKMRAMVALEQRLYRNFPAVVAVSEPIRSILLNFGVNADRVHVIRNGVQVGDASGDPTIADALRAEIGLLAAEPCILNAGRLAEQKAQHDIVAAAGILRGQGVPACFLIVGDGDLREQLEQRVREEGLEEFVKLLGFRTDIADLMQIADLFLLPSLDEGMPMSLLEAGAAGLAAVVTPVGDVPKLVADDETGLVIDPGDPAGIAAAVKSLLEDGSRRTRLGESLRRKVWQLYSVEAMFEQYDRVYDSVLNGN